MFQLSALQADIIGLNCLTVMEHEEHLKCCFTLMFWPESVPRKLPPQEEILGRPLVKCNNLAQFLLYTVINVTF